MANGPRRSREAVLSFRIAIRAALPFAALVAATAAAQEPQSFHLALPLDCTFGETCFIQQYFDHDPSKGVKDYRGGTMSYDGHNGVDLRVATMAAQQRGVSVVAAAAGVVKAVRDGIADVNVHQVGLDNIVGRECGNGVLIDHGGGWETLYCHMANRSVRVRTGERVEAGAPIGLVGLSGQTEFPHLHFSVGCNGIVIDPFAADAARACGATKPLWSEGAADALAYHSPAVINFGFAAERMSIEDVEFGRAGATPPNSESPALIAYVRAIGLKAADVQRFTLRGPDGTVLAQTENPPLDRNMAERFMYVGQRKGTAKWQPGRYEAEFQIKRDGVIALLRRFSLDLK